MPSCELSIVAFVRIQSLVSKQYEAISDIFVVFKEEQYNLKEVSAGLLQTSLILRLPEISYR